uniref:Uncharacterized protein n=1 Tax=Avena sativa TaxID=4498 RepID=A0ACD5ZMM6_AVESA
MLLRKKPILSSDESGLKQSLSNYFLEELKKRPIKEIVDVQVQEEATEEEINNVASLAEMCLRLRGEERPTMKEVEMTLQLLRSKRSKSYHAQSSARTRAEAGVQSQLNYEIDPISANSQRCYSLELEFLSSASLPR